MVKNLYEALGVQQDVPPEEIRKAYRKMALQTHPDRLQPGASDTDKAYAEEQFRKVNNAYEVLSDEEKRKVYDRHGEWPPPEVQQDPYADRSHHRRHHRHRSHANARRRGDPFYSSPFGDSFFTQPFGTSPYARAHAHAHYGFTDPFTLFDSMFGEMRRHFNDQVFADAHPSAGPTFGHQPFNHDLFFDRMMGGNTAFRMLPQMNNMFMQPNVPSQGRTANFQSSSRGVFTQGADGNGQWVSQSRMTRSINGVTESVWKRMDSNGNEHITYSYPDGREKHLINGVEQPTISGGHGGRSLPPPPPYPGPTPANTLYEQSRKQGHNRADMNQHPAGPYNSANVKHEHEYDRERERHREHRGHQRDHYEDQDHQKKRLWKW